MKNSNHFCVKQAMIDRQFPLDKKSKMSTEDYHYFSLLSLPFCMFCHSLFASQDRVKGIFDSMIDTVNNISKNKKQKTYADSVSFLRNIPHANYKERKFIAIEQFLYLFLLNEIGLYEKDYEKLGIVYAFCNVVQAAFGIKVNFFDMPVIKKVYEKLGNGDIEKLSYKEFLIALRIIIISNGDIEDFLIRSYCIRFNIISMSFSRSVLTHGGLGFKMTGYSLEEGSVECHTEHLTFPRDIIDGTYFFERKIIEKIIKKFGTERFYEVSNGRKPTNIFDLSKSFINKPCLYYELIKYTDEGLWSQAMNIIDELEDS